MFKNIRSFSVNPWFFACLALMVLVDSAGYMLIILITVAIHESGHLFAFNLFRIPVKQIRLQAFGIRIDPAGGLLMSNGRTAVIAAAGPVLNLAAFACCYLLSRLFLLPNFLLLFGATNLFLSLFNLLPMPPLDGGKLLGCLLCPIVGEDRARLVQAVVGAVCGIVALGLGVYILVRSGLNISLCVLGSYMLICMAIKLFNYRKKRKKNVGSELGEGFVPRTEAGTVYRG